MLALLTLCNALALSLWWVAMKQLARLPNTTENEIKFPKNLIRCFSGLSALVLVLGSLWWFGWTYHQSLPWQFWAWLGGAIALNVGIAYCYIEALDRSPLAIAVHVTSLVPAVALCTEWAMMGRMPAVSSCCGIGVVLVGLYILHFNPDEYSGSFLGPVFDIWHKRARWLWYAIAIAVLAGFAVPIDRQCVLLSKNPLLAPGLTLGIAWGIVFAIVALRRHDFQELTHFPRRLVVRYSLLLCSCFVVALAAQGSSFFFQSGAAVAALKRLDQPLTVVWSRLLLKEEETISHTVFLWRVSGSFIAFLGAVILVFFQ